MTSEEQGIMIAFHNHYFQSSALFLVTLFAGIIQLYKPCLGRCTDRCCWNLEESDWELPPPCNTICNYGCQETWLWLYLRSKMHVVAVAKAETNIETRPIKISIYIQHSWEIKAPLPEILSCNRNWDYWENLLPCSLLSLTQNSKETIAAASECYRTYDDDP